MTTNEYIQGVNERGWAPFDRRLWQRTYYDHVIRDEDELRRVRQYILANPTKWAFVYNLGSKQQEVDVDG